MTDIDFTLVDQGPAPWREQRFGSKIRLKRLFDVLFALTALITLSPLLLATGLSVRIYGGPGPVIYRHTRIGRDGRAFACLKFRSMVADADDRLAQLLANDPAKRTEFSQFQKLRDDPRVIPGIGTFLRASSFDELPQFWNVLRGDMSVVGPRPVTVDELARYGDFAAHYCSVRPGITGSWQTAGRSDLDFDRRIALDVRYVEQLSLWQDAIYICRTFAVLANRRGAC